MTPRQSVGGWYPESVVSYRRPSRWKRAGLIALGAAGAVGVACGGGGGDKSISAEQWVETDGAAGRINLDDVAAAYKDAYKDGGFKVEQFEQRVNEIYEGDNIVLVRVERQGDTAIVSGWEDLNGDKEISDATDDKLFSITQELKDNGSYTTQGYGANGYYQSSNPFGGFFTGFLLASMFSGGRTTYVTPPGYYDTLNSSRSSYRNSNAYDAQRSRNSSYGNGISNRFGGSTATQSVSPARSSYQSRQVNSGGFRSTASGSGSGGSRSITSGAKGGSSSGGGLSGGGGAMRL